MFEQEKRTKRLTKQEKVSQAVTSGHCTNIIGNCPTLVICDECPCWKLVKQF